MRSIDIAIIYLACGAPIAAEYALRIGTSLSVATTGRFFLRLLVWPIYAFQLVFNFFNAQGRKIAEKSSVRHQLDGLRGSIETELGYGSLTVATFNFRELFDRYTGLAIDASILDIDTGVSELLKLGEHPNIALANKCIQRRNLAALKEHSRRATIDFRDFIDAKSKITNDGIKDLAVEAAHLIGDGVTAAGMPFIGKGFSNKTRTIAREAVASTN